jgi:NADH-quinone oxidoreductase subunit J
MSSIAFYVLAAAALGGALGVILHRTPVISALFLVLTLGAVAGLFFLLGAQFLGTVKVLVYAGAIVVLIVFMIMLLNLPREEGLPAGMAQGTLAVLLGFALLHLLVKAGLSYRPEVPDRFLEHTPPGFGLIAHVGGGLFGTYFFAFEAISLVLIVAMAGAILLAKRDL